MATQSPQKCIRTLDWKYKAPTTLSKCWCFLSTTKFCCGRSTQQTWWKVSYVAKKSESQLFCIVRSNTLNWWTKLCFYHLKKLLDCICNFGLVFQQKKSKWSDYNHQLKWEKIFCHFMYFWHKDPIYHNTQDQTKSEKYD